MNTAPTSTELKVETPKIEDSTAPEIDAFNKLPPVKHGHVMPYAKKGCSTCFGSGEFVLHLGRIAKTPKDGKAYRLPFEKGQDKVKAKLCGCALRRFLKNRSADVVQAPSGAMCWKEGVTVPELGKL
jgi:hypothetical protein